MKVTVLRNQSLFDIAIRETGSASTVFDLVQQNDVGLTDGLLPSTSVDVPDKDYGFKAVVDFFRANPIFPATAIDDLQLPDQQSGIGFMAVALTFKIN